jgi:hypothetical protein
MNETRIDAVWRHMGQMFGVDVLVRKFGEVPPEDWQRLVNRLSDYELQKGMRRLANSGRTFPPSLPEFLKMAHEVGGDYPGDERYNPKQIAAPTNNMDGWDAMAGLKLLGYIARRAGKREYFDGETTQPLVDAKNLWAEEMREHQRNGTMPPDNGKAFWGECFRNAELAIKYIRDTRGKAFEC